MDAVEKKSEQRSVRRKQSMIMRLLIGILLGGAAGFAYYRFVGCSSGVCPITSNPYISTVYGAIMGALVSVGNFG
jgi:hypothetical protein